MNPITIILILSIMLFISGIANILAVLMLKENENRLIAEIRNNEKLKEVIETLGRN